MNQRLIAYRGNIQGNKPYFLNKPEYVDIALQYGYDAMVDVWIKDGEYWLGHDNPRYAIPTHFLSTKGIWCRAMTREALDSMMNEKDIHCFMNGNDPIVLTNRNIMWLNDSTKLFDDMKSDAVYFDPEGAEETMYRNIYAICSNNVRAIREILTGEQQREFNMNDARDIADIIPDLDNFTG